MSWSVSYFAENSPHVAQCIHKYSASRNLVTLLSQPLLLCRQFSVVMLQNRDSNSVEVELERNAAILPLDFFSRPAASETALRRNEMM